MNKRINEYIFINMCIVKLGGLTTPILSSEKPENA